eukprot:15463691-Alexandrium_andersonii.AAC.2
MAEAHRREANTPPQRPFRALSGPPPDGRRTMGESALTGQLGVPLCGAPCCYVKASSHIVRRPSGGGPERALKGLCGGVLASLLGVSARGRRPMSRLTPKCYDLADLLVSVFMWSFNNNVSGLLTG